MRDIKPIIKFTEDEVNFLEEVFQKLSEGQEPYPMQAEFARQELCRTLLEKFRASQRLTKLIKEGENS